MNECRVLTAHKSTHRVEVVPVVLEPHPNADSLSLVRVFGYTVCVRTADWVGVDRGAYIVPDSVVDTTRPEFQFLDGHSRIRVKRLRGIMSHGLLMPSPMGAQIGEDVAEQLCVTRHEPPLPGEKKLGYTIGGESAEGPSIITYKYDVDAWRRYRDRFVAGEDVVVTEKVHGSSSRYVYWDGQMYCGSRLEWKKEHPNLDHLTVEYLTAQNVPEDKALEIIGRVKARPIASRRNLWWRALTPDMEEFCQSNPGVVLYGEVYGNVQDLKYGLDGVRFIGFDLLCSGQWMDWEACQRTVDCKIPWVPVLYRGPYDEATVEALADGESVVALWNGHKQIREGAVVKPVIERTDQHIGRVQLKLVSDVYLERV